MPPSAAQPKAALDMLSKFLKGQPFTAEASALVEEA